MPTRLPGIPMPLRQIRSTTYRTSPGPLLLWAVTLLFPTALAAQDVDLTWSYRPGSEHRYRIGVETHSSTPMGEALQTTVQTVRQEVLAVEAGGGARVALTFEHVRTAQDSPLGRQEFDSARDPQAGDPASAILSAMVGETVQMILSPTGEALEVIGLEELAERMFAAAQAAFPGGGGGAMREIFQGMVDQSALAPVIQPPLPAGPTAPGATWQHGSELALPVGTSHSSQTFTFDGVDEVGGSRVARISMQGTLGELVPAPGNPLAGIMEMAGGVQRGESQVDLDRGLLLRSSVRSELTVVALGQETRVVTTHEVERVDP